MMCALSFQIQALLIHFVLNGENFDTVISYGVALSEFVFLSSAHRRRRLLGVF